MVPRANSLPTLTVLRSESGGYRFPFKNPYVSAGEIKNVAQALESGQRSSGGRFMQQCEDWLLAHIGGSAALLVQSCTAGLELAQVLTDVGPGDEVIMPSFSFSSVANAVALRGGVPVFVDIRADTLNIDERLVGAAIGPKTKAIVCVHYGGVAAEMNSLLALAQENGLILIEDAAHAFQSSYKGRPAGGLAHIGVFSFHDTKDLNCGEGGAVIVNDANLAPRALVLAEKGTNRKEFLAGRISQYEWVDLGHSAKPSEITAAVLWAQLQHAETIRAERARAWSAYHSALEVLERSGFLRRQIVPDECGINGHSYYVILDERIDRAALIGALKRRGVETSFHFTPLHSSPAGKRLAKSVGAFINTDAVASRILRLPLWPGIACHCGEIVSEIERAVAGRS